MTDAPAQRRPRRMSKLEQINKQSLTTSLQAQRYSSSDGPSSSSRAHTRSLPDTRSPPVVADTTDHAPAAAAGATLAAAPDPPSAESPMLSATSRSASELSINSMAGAPAPPPLRSHATTLNVPGLTRSKVSPDGRIASRDIGSKLVIVMVGLPARGKSYVTKKLARFLNWQQHNCRIFNVGNTRRRANQDVGPASQPLPDVPGAGPEGETSHAADFFSPDNAKSVTMREQWAFDTLNELLDYVIDGDGAVGILDATNTTVGRRRMVLERIKERSDGQLKVLYLESICTRKDIIEANIALKLSGPDYRHMDRETAIKDFVSRLHNYERAYETIGPEEEADPQFQYIKMINVGQKVECANIKGFLAGQTVFFLLNFNLDERQIWITRHGESTDNEKGRIGGDAHLTERGRKFSAALSSFMEHKRKEFRKRQLERFSDKVRYLERRNSQPPTPLNEPEEVNFCVWSSMLQRAIETARPFDDQKFDIKEMRMLNELDAGLCDGMSYEEINIKFPDEYKARVSDKIRYRYPGIGGESYLDVINRLRPVIVEIERMSDNCLVICHRVVARVLLAYFLNLGQDAIGQLEVPLHTLYCLEPKPYGVDFALYKYNERDNWFYRVPKEMVTLEGQLSDQRRRLTVLPTVNVELGDSRQTRDDEVVLDSDADTEATLSDRSGASTPRVLREIHEQLQATSLR